MQNDTYRGALKPDVGNHQKTSDAQESTPMKIQEEEILNFKFNHTESRRDKHQATDGTDGITDDYPNVIPERPPYANGDDASAVIRQLYTHLTRPCTEQMRQ